MKAKKLSDGLRKYIRRQKMIIKRMAKNKEEEELLLKELLNRFYQRTSPQKADSASPGVVSAQGGSPQE